MQAGLLRKRIAIKKSTQTQNSFGEKIYTWTNFAIVWAEVVPVTGREFFESNQFIQESTIKFRIRYRNDFNESAQISYDGATYDIIYIAEIGNKDGIEILAKKP